MKRFVVIYPGLRSILVLFFLCLITFTYPAQAATIGSWEFEEGSGDTAADSSGNNNDGTLEPDETTGPQWTDGFVGYGLEFDNDYDYVDCDNYSNFNLSLTDHSIELWFNLSNGQVCNYEAGAPTTGYQIKITEDGKVYYEETADGGDSISIKPTNQWSFNAWHHLVITVSLIEKTAHYYMDGKYIASDTYTGDLVSNAGNLYLGGGPSTNYSFKGKMDQVTIHDYALTAQEVLASYNNDKYLYGFLFASYAFEDGSGTTAQDSSDYANDATLMNSPQWTEGMVGGGLEFNDDNDYLDCGTDIGYDFSSTDHSLELWFNLAENQVCNYTEYPPESGYQIKVTADGKVYYEEATDGGDSIEIHPDTQYDPNTWYHLAITVSTSEKIARYYIDGEYITSDTYTGDLVNTAGNLYLGGGGPDTNYSFKGKMDQINIYAKTLTSQEVRDHYLYDKYGPLFLVYAFEEGSGATVLDSSGYGNDGTLMPDAAIGPQRIEGKIGEGLEFDDEDDYVDCGTENYYILASTDHSIELWFNLAEAQIGNYTGGAPEAGYQIRITADGKVYYEEAADGGDSIKILPDIQYDSDIWHHLAVTVSVDTKTANYYMDGKYVASDTYTGELIGTNGNLYLGGAGPGTDYSFQGKMDQVSLYSKALTAQEILDHYLSDKYNQGLLLLAYAFEDGSGATVTDASAYANDGTLEPDEANGPQWAGGAVGGGLEFDDEDDYVDCGTNDNYILASTDHSIELWFNLAENQVCNYNDPGLEAGYLVKVTADGKVYYEEASDGGDSIALHPETQYNPNTWHHLVVTVSTDTKAAHYYMDGEYITTDTYTGELVGSNGNLYLGGGGPGTNYSFKGKMDQVNIYARTLTAAEVAENYEAGVLVLYYAFEEGTGNVALDSSGYENDATLINGPQWVDGRLGNGLSFDGNDDYLNCGNQPEYNLACFDHSIEAWFKADKPTDDYARLFSRFTGGTPGAGYWLGMRTTGQIEIQERSDGASPIWMRTSGDYGDNKWHHLVYVVDTNEKKAYLYIDSSCVYQRNYTGNLIDYNTNLSIGGVPVSSHNWNGLIDEVKIYRRVLSEIEVEEDYIEVIHTVFISPSLDGSTVNASWLTVTGEVYDDKATVIVGGVYATVNGDGTFTANNVLLNQGENTITVYALHEDGTVTSDTITITTNTLTDPVTITSAQPLSGTAPLNVQFTISTDVEGTITEYAWDWEGDGVYDWSSSSTGDTNHTYTEEQIYHPTIRITTDAGIQYTATVTITVCPVPVVLDEWSITDPIDLALDSERNVYILQRSSTAQIKIYDKDGTELDPITLTASNPSGIVVDANGKIYITDTGNDQIQRLLSDGTLDTTFDTDGILGQSGTGEVEFDQPYGIAVDDDGNIYVTDCGNHRIQKLDSTGTFIKEWGSYGTEEIEFDQPKGICLDEYNYLYVTDSNNQRIQKMSDSGSFYSEFGTPGSNQGQFNQPVDVAIDQNYNTILIADSNNDRIQLFDRDDEAYKIEIVNLNLDTPSAVVADKDIKAQIIYIADTGNNRVLKVKIPVGGNTPEAVWNNMKQALINDDIEEALSCFYEYSRDKYEEIFTELSDVLSIVASDMGEIQCVYVKEDLAKYRIHRLQKGTEVTYYIYFFKDKNGNWKIESF